MAGESLQTIFNALSQEFEPDFHQQWNRTAVFLDQIRASPGGVTESASGKNVAFDVEFTGATAQTVAEGSDVADSEFASDVDAPFILPWATYRTSFKVTEQEIDAARKSAGTPSALRDIFGARILSAGAILADQIERDALTGTGVDSNGNPTIIGIYGGALAASGAYGGLNVATYPEWAGNVLSNGGTLRSLTPDLMEQADANIFTNSSQPWNLIMSSAGVVRKYTAMFTQGPPGTNLPLVRMNDNAGRPVYGLSPSIDQSGQLDAVYFKGRRVLRNRVNPANKLALLNTDKIRMKYLPRALSEADKAFMQTMGIEGINGDAMNRTATGMQMRLLVLAQTGDSIKISARITCQMAVVRRNACALVTDISES